jgi:RimJ/RimL family protein N-acetyltransferase
MIMKLELATQNDLDAIIAFYDDVTERTPEMAIRLAQSKGMQAIRLDALASNTPAHKIYERLGFEYRGKQHLYAENTGWTDFYFFDYAQQHVFEYKNK